MVGLIFYFLPTTQAQTVSIDPNVRLQKLDGWGTSLSWWANLVGNYPQAQIDMICDDLADPNELNFNIFRYNIHGGDNPSLHHGTTVNHFRWDSGDITSYKSSASAPYNWNANAAQRKILTELLLRNPNLILDAQSNSPPYWMTLSGCSGGGINNAPNLNSNYEDDFADFLTDIVKHYHDNFNITFNTITPTNEPVSGYWGIGGSQEGCGIFAGQQMNLIEEIYSQLSAKGMLSYCGLSGPDETSYTQTWNDLIQYQHGNAIFDKVKQISTHSYEGEHKSGISGLVNEKGLKLYQSESGPLYIGPITGLRNHLFIADRIVDDLRLANVNAWIDWQAASKNNLWGFFTLNQNNTNLIKGKNFYVRKQFSKYLKQGYQLIYSGHDQTIAALSPDNSQLVLVYVNNTNTGNTLTFDLSEFCYEGGPVQIYRTSGSENTQPYTINGTNGSLTYSSPSNSITTLLVDVTVSPPHQELADGLYRIRNKFSNKHVAVQGLSTANGTDIVQWTNPNFDNFLFEVKKMGHDYLIKPRFHNRILTVTGGATNNGAIVEQYDDSGMDYQRFIVRPTSDGYYKVVAKHSDRYWAIHPAVTTNGARLVQQDEGTGDNFKWSFEPATVAQPIASGVYKIKAVHSNKYMKVANSSYGIGALIEQQTSSNQPNQRFQVEYNNSGYYTFSPVYNKKQLDIAGGSGANGAKLTQYTALSAVNQQFKLEPVAGGAYKIAPKHAPTKVLNVAGESLVDGADVIIWDYNGGDHCHWVFESQLIAPTSLTISDPNACLGNVVALAAVGGNSGGVGILRYFKDKCGGTLISNPNAVTITEDAEYFVRYQSALGHTPCVSAEVICNCENFDLFLNAPNLEGLYKVGNTIISNGQVQPGDTTLFDGGLEIILKPGFDANFGSGLDTRLDGCNQ